MGADSEIDSELFATYMLSLERCRNRPDFLQKFYNRFFGSSEDIRALFPNTDIQLQKRMLDTALRELPSLEGARVSAEVERIAKRHSRGHLNVAPDHGP